MNNEEFKEEIRKLNISLNDNMLKQLEIYYNFLIEYNSHTNLTAIKEKEDVYLKHFYDSLTIVKSVDINKVDSLLDIGTGAGFPGMVLKIIFPHINITLIDSNNKKTKFLSMLKDKLEIDINVINMRVEDYAKDNLNRFDVVTSRAVANLRVLSEISLPLVKENGLFIAMKGKIDNKFEDALDTIDILNSKIINNINFELYKANGDRNIIVIKKLKETIKDQLRSYDKIVKKPLKKKNK